MRANRPKTKSKAKPKPKRKVKAKVKAKPKRKAKASVKAKAKGKVRPARKSRGATRRRMPVRSAVASLMAIVEGPLAPELPIDDHGTVVTINSDALEILNDTQAVADPEPDPAIVAATSADRKRAQVLSGGDPDAEWDQADEGGEAVGGSMPTPDQDLVDDIGRAAGVTYDDNEPIKPEEKVAARDEKRWEVDPASSEDYRDRLTELRRRKRRP